MASSQLPIKNPDVLIIGGGIIGLSTAYELTKQGVSVTVIEKGHIGMQCSYGNAGWLTPCFSMPLPMPGMLIKATKWLFDPDSPLYIKPEPSALLAKWMTRFLLSMNQTHLKRSVKVLTELSNYTLDEYLRIQKLRPGELELEQKGLLMISNNEEGVKSCVNELNLVTPHGVTGREVNEADIHKLEPAITGKVLGGVYFDKEAHLEPLKAVQTLATMIREKGGVVLENTEVFGFHTNSQGKVESIETTHGPLRAKQFVLATGTWSNAIGNQLKLNIPIMGGKGYSIISKPLKKQPQIPIMILDKKIAITPRSDSIRIAGTLELVDQDFSITSRRVQAILNGARNYLSFDEEEIPKLEVWRGLRPCSSDGVPLIGKASGYQNLFLNCGHQLLGLQSSLGSGKLLTEILLNQKTFVDDKPFNPARF